MSVWIGRYNVFLAWLRVNSRVRLGVVCGCLAVLCFVMVLPDACCSRTCTGLLLSRRKQNDKRVKRKRVMNCLYHGYTE